MCLGTEAEFVKVLSQMFKKEIYINIKFTVTIAILSPKKQIRMHGAASIHQIRLLLFGKMIINGKINPG
jgi:hypothetical protein